MSAESLMQRTPGARCCWSQLVARFSFSVSSSIDIQDFSSLSFQVPIDVGSWGKFQSPEYSPALHTSEISSSSLQPHGRWPLKVVAGCDLDFSTFGPYDAPLRAISVTSITARAQAAKPGLTYQAQGQKARNQVAGLGLTWLNPIQP